MQAHELKRGHVLVDTEGHLYEVVGIHSGGDETVYAWLWPDSSPVPNYWQGFKPDEDIVSINEEHKEAEATDDGAGEAAA